MASICEGRTVLLVTQRLSVARKADKVLFMKDGRVTDLGSHLGLGEKEGKFCFHMYCVF